MLLLTAARQGLTCPFAFWCLVFQVVRGESRRGTLVSALGLPLPAQWGWVAQLALTHVAAPDASFAGHVCGVLAGIAHVYLLRPGEGRLAVGVWRWTTLA